MKKRLGSQQISKKPLSAGKVFFGEGERDGIMREGLSLGPTLACKGSKWTGQMGRGDGGRRGPGEAVDDRGRTAGQVEGGIKFEETRLKGTRLKDRYVTWR